MKRRVEVTNQAELDDACAKGNIAICIGRGYFTATASAHVEAWESSHVEAWESSHVVAWESSHVVAWQSSHVVARGSSHVVARGSSHVEARESSHVEAWESSHVVAWGSSHVEARGRSHVEAWGSSHVVAWESSHVVAWQSSHVEARGSSHVEAWQSSHVEARGNAFLRLFSALKIKASLSVIIALHGDCKDIEGGQQIKAVVPTTPQQWCEFHGVEVEDGVAILYKAVTDSYQSGYKFDYSPGTTPFARDWDGGRQECGKGLHFCPTPGAAKSFHSDATKFLACPVALIAMRAPQADDQHPDKIKAQCCCAPIYEVDISGKVVEKQVAA